MRIDQKLAHQLIKDQFPQWAHLAIHPVKTSGWDNRIFHLGEDMLVRMPSAACYVQQVDKEQLWLPKLAPSLPVKIPSPLAQGTPSEYYPWEWSIYRWIKGETAASSPNLNRSLLAKDLANFLLAFQRISTDNGPMAGEHNFYRGGLLSIYDAETRQAIKALNHRIDARHVTEIWEAGSSSKWQKEPVWVHGDISAGNLLIDNGRLNAVIDFGLLCIGDPACDLVIAWTFLDEADREVFRHIISPDSDTWARARSWALWKALIVINNPASSNRVEAKQAHRTLDHIITDYNLEP